MTGAVPLVSVLVPTYNGAQFIERTLEALAAQTWPNLEIVIGEDRSTDDTLAIVQRFSATHLNVRVIANERNMGWLENSNTLMAAARGELLCFGFHDDIPERTYIEALAKRLLEKPEAVLAFCDFELHEIDGSMRVIRFTEMENRQTILSRSIQMARRTRDWYAPNRGVFRASAFSRSGGLKASPIGDFAADWLWLLELSTYGDFIRVPEVLLRKYYLKSSLSQSWEHTNKKYSVLQKFAADVIGKSAIPPLERFLLHHYLARDIPRRERQLAKLFRGRRS
jgi:glycosyltransferase involved in cell wall biosynthesis